MAAPRFSRRADSGPRDHAEAYVRHLLAPLPAEAGRWLEAQGVPAEVAAREMGWAVRAIGLIVASRDALDDRTVSEVSHALDRALGAGSDFREGGAVHWRARWAAYLEAHAARGTGEPVPRRLARVLLDGAGVQHPSPALLEAAGAEVVGLRVRLNAELGRAFGLASLPDDVRPSAVAPRRSPGSP